MFRSVLIWRMAWKQLVKQRSQTLLSIVGGSIAVILIICSVVFIQSFGHSGKRWLSSHLGPVDWVLTPPAHASGVFTPQQLSQLNETLAPIHGQVNLLPIMSLTSPIMKINGEGEVIEAAPRAHVMSFNWEDARGFDPDFTRRYSVELTEDEAIIDSQAADRLNLEPGDVMALTDHKGGRQLFRLRTVAEPLGLTGFRGVSGATATVLISETRAMELAGVQEKRYQAVLAGRSLMSLKPAIFPLFSDGKLYKVIEIKKDAADSIGKLKVTYGSAFILLSSVAVISGFLLMFQIMMMLAESHREQFGVFRAIGLSKKQVRGIFLAETSLLSLAATTVGTLIGSALGFGLVHLFEKKYGPSLARSESLAIPVGPYVSLPTLLVSSCIIFVFLTAIAFLAAKRNERFTIMELIRGASLVSKQSIAAKRKSWRYRITFLLCLTITGVHGYHLFTGEGRRMLLMMDYPHNALLPALVLFATWLIAFACFLLVLIFIFTSFVSGLTSFLKRFGFGPVSIYLASRYPAQNLRRTWIVGILFGLVLLSITFTLIVSRWYFGFSDVDRTNQTILGYAGQAGYRTAAEKEMLAQLITRDEVLHRELSDMTVVEPLRIAVHENWLASTVLPVSESLTRFSNIKLSARDSQFRSDSEAWREVAANPRAIIMDEKFMRPAHNGPPGAARPVYHTGQKLKLPVFASKPRRAGEKWIPAMEVEAIIVGFAETQSETHTSLQYYDSIYVHSSVHSAMKAYATRWPDDLYIGEILFNLDYKHLETVQLVEDRFISKGVQSVLIPYHKNASDAYMTKQMVSIFIGFLILSVVIGLSGLAIIQIRAVKERAMQMAMMRCMGISSRDIQQFYLIEGTAIGWMGLLSGLLFGSSGGDILIQTYEHTIGLQQKPYVFSYPWGTVLLVTAGILAVTILVNLAPARQSLRVTPGDAVRSADN